MIVITGATGQLGHLVIKHLLKTLPANEIVAAVRNIEKAADLAALGIELRLADYNQPETLSHALQGADKLLLISSSEIGQRIVQHQAVINAAKKVGVGLIAYTSILHADSSPLPLAAEHKATEQLLSESGILYVLLRNGWYSENYTAGLATAIEHGAIIGSAQQGRISSASRDDYAAAAAVVLQKNDQEGHIYELAGDQSYTLSDLATELSRQVDKNIVYQDLPKADYRKTLLSFDLPEALATLIVESDAGAAQDGLFDDSQQLSQLIGRSTTSLEESVKAVLISIPLNK